MVHGKGIVFARRNVQVGPLPGRTGVPWIADIPSPGEKILEGRPVCTVFAAARTPERCRKLLRERAAAVYRSLRSHHVRAA
jgi:predicted ATP-grasp superfamily ATP-dependent carboligase